MTAIREYLDEKGDSPFAQWFEGLDITVAAKVASSLYRMEQGNFSRVKGVSGGIFECKIDFGKDGEMLVILLGGGSKKRQAVDIEAAMSCWRDYKRRKR